ncbi:hypothetical protein GGF44_005180, partial [Coemansia sp. RSA 1694]
DSVYSTYEFSGYNIELVEDLEEVLSTLSTLPDHLSSIVGIKMLIYTPEYKFRRMAFSSSTILHGELLLIDTYSSFVEGAFPDENELRAIVNSADKYDINADTHPLD